MFRDGQYLEVIKASDNCLATAVVTVQEKIMKIRKKKVLTNKWLDLEDWAALYAILEKAILRNVRKEGLSPDSEKLKGKKSTRQLEVTYTFEPSENVKDVASLPTIRVNVSPAKKKLGKTKLSESTSEKNVHNRTSQKSQRDATDSTHQTNRHDTLPKKLETNNLIAKVSSDTRKDRTKRYLQLESSGDTTLEEYVPDTPVTKKLCTHLKYIPSRKSMLEQIQVSSNEYSPSISDNKSVTEVVRYIPNSVDSTKVSYETYEPSSTTIVNLPEIYVPTSKGVKASIEEYQPDFTSKSMKFDDSYVPSSVQLINKDAIKSSVKLKKVQSKKYSSRQKDTSSKRNICLPEM